MNTISTQMNFWIIAYFFLATILFFFTRSTGLQIPLATDPLPFFVSSFIMSVLFGFLTGIGEYFVFNRRFTSRSIGYVIVAKGLFYIVVMSLVFLVLRFAIWQYLVDTRYPDQKEILLSNNTAMYSYFTMVIFTLVMGMVISFIVQINTKYGPGVLIPILMGKYLSPKEEERVFMFLDLKSSTSIAEKIGHMKYSELIRDCFIDVNEVAKKYRAEIYQYVGDEVVMHWLSSGFNNKITVVQCFFEIKFRLESKQEFYLKKYGLLPEFKAGAHLGIVTAVEVGSIKREVAYHGDTMNVTSRIEGKTKEFHANLLISKNLADTIEWDDRFTAKPIVSVYLSGRQKPITLLDVHSYLEK
jgi:adenylate cyclase